MAVLKGHVIWVCGPLSDGATAYIREINSLLTTECLVLRECKDVFAVKMYKSGRKAALPKVRLKAYSVVHS